MPSIDLEFFSNLKDNYKNYNNFIETGTCYGNTIFTLEPYFSQLYTIEIQKIFYETVKNQYNGDKINFYLGDSSIILPKILPNIKGKSIIFLDGHYSSGNTGKGEKDCPLYEELEAIIQNHEDEAIVIIDDANLFGKGPNKNTCAENWEDINIDTILKIVKKRNILHYEVSINDTNNKVIIHISK